MPQSKQVNNIEKNRKMSFPGQKAGEKVNLFFRKHPLSFFGFSLIGLGMIIIPIILFVFITNSEILTFDSLLEPKILVAGLSVYILFVLGLMIVAWMNYYLDVYIITDRRLIDIHQEGLFSRNLTAVDLVDVEDVNAEVKGILQTYFNFGDVYVQTAGRTQNLNFDQVPQPYMLARKTMDYHEEVVREEKEVGAKDEKKRTKLEKLDKVETGEKRRKEDDSSQPEDPFSKINQTKEEPPQQEQTKKVFAEKENKDDKKKANDKDKDESLNKEDLKKGGQIDLK